MTSSDFIQNDSNARTKEHVPDENPDSGNDGPPATRHDPSSGDDSASDIVTPSAPSYFESDGHQATFVENVFAPQSDGQQIPAELSGYRLLDKVGQGGSGIVFRAESIANGEVVAVKILRPDVANPRVIRRFEKECRVQAEMQSPYLTRLIEFGNQYGFHFIVSEFIDGVSLRVACNWYSRQPMEAALTVIADALKGLAALHSRNVVHRDVKPENIMALFERDPVTGDFDYHRFISAKLTDFGLARHVEQSESLDMTRQQTILGTPLYLAPEQYSESRNVDARADIYSVGATLFHMLTGQPPFEADDSLSLAAMHRNQRPRDVVAIRPELGDAISHVIARSLEKEPELRYSDAAEMLADIECVQAGRPTRVRVFPDVPNADDPGVRVFRFEWELNSAPAALWPLVSDTGRINEAIGLPAPDFKFVGEGNDRQIFATARFAGMKVRWREHPFEWVHASRLSVFREFESGPFEWVTSTVELGPLCDGKTRLTHRFQVKPRGIIGRLLTPFQFNRMTRRSLDKVYHRLDSLAADLANPIACYAPFSGPVSLSGAARKRLNAALASMQVGSADAATPATVLERFEEFLTTAADVSVARIRPKVLAEKLHYDAHRMVELCLNSTTAGLLELLWDVICPVCRISAATHSSLGAIDDHAHCEACNMDFQVDLAHSVELIFRVHPQIRSVETATYCIGGPFHSPHVLAQCRLDEDEEEEFGLALAPGHCAVRSPSLTHRHQLIVTPDATLKTAQVHFPGDTLSSRLQPGFAAVRLRNRTSSRLMLRVELAAGHDEALTAAEASGIPLFRKLFPGELVSADQLVSVSRRYAVMVRVSNFGKLADEIGEIAANEIVSEFAKKAQRDSGVDDQNVQRPDGDSMILLCDDVAAAIDGCIACRRNRMRGNQRLELAFAIDGGEVFFRNDNRSDSFGAVIRKVKSLVSNAGPEQICVSELPRDTEEFRKFAGFQLKIAGQHGDSTLYDFDGEETLETEHPA